MGVNNKESGIFTPVIIALALGSVIFTGLRLLNHTNTGKARGALLFSTPNKIEQAFELIKSSYVDSVSSNMIEEEAIKGMLKNLDPHSQYFPASDFSAINDPIEGNFSGIGVQVNMMNDTIVIINTVAKGPSEEVGIMAGDRIVRVNDSLVAGVKMPSNDIVRMLKGKTGSVVKVGISRKGNSERLDFNITRGKIPLFSIAAAYMIAPEIGYIKVNNFSKTTLQEFSDAAAKLKAEGMTKTIVDLRGNPGGIINGAIGMCKMFLPEGKLIVYTDGIKQGRINYFSSGKNTEYHTMELVLLMDESSASASEIVAGAIQDNDRGTIIGRRSFGKGLVQQQHLLSDGSVMRITVARYYTPTGRCIQKPYESNEDNNYFNELHERYAHGEMTQADSIRFNDSLRYVTPKGKVVYGGGGIMPDIFVPIDTANYSGYYAQVMRRGLMYRFAFDYVDEHRKDMTALQDDKALVAYLQHRNILNEFTTYATGQGVTKNNQDLKTSGALIENIIMAYIGRIVLDNRGFYPILNRMDKIVQKGVEVLRVKL